MTITFARETYAQMIEDVKPMLAEHWRELALYQDDIPLDPDYEFYERAEAIGLIRAYTARKVGALIGYAVYLVRFHPHYRGHRWASADIVWMHPDYRRFGAGNALFDFIESDLTAEGPCVIHTTTKVAHPELSMLLLARGHEHVENGYSKRLAAAGAQSAPAT